eukprot:1195828-Prorocentrum_minimum.AAC.8
MSAGYHRQRYSGIPQAGRARRIDPQLPFFRFRLAISISGPLQIQFWRFSISEFRRFSIVETRAFAHGEFETGSVREIREPETIRR